MEYNGIKWNNMDEIWLVAWNLQICLFRPLRLMFSRADSVFKEPGWLIRKWIVNISLGFNGCFRNLGNQIFIVFQPYLGCLVDMIHIFLDRLKPPTSDILLANSIIKSGCHHQKIGASAGMPCCRTRSNLISTPFWAHQRRVWLLAGLFWDSLMTGITTS